EPNTILTNNDIVTPQQLTNENINGHHPNCFLNVALECTKTSINNIGAHHIIEQTNLLNNERNGATQQNNHHPAHILPINRNTPSLNIEETKDQVEDRRFPGS